MWYNFGNSWTSILRWKPWIVAPTKGLASPGLIHLERTMSKSSQYSQEPPWFLSRCHTFWPQWSHFIWHYSLDFGCWELNPRLHTCEVCHSLLTNWQAVASLGCGASGKEVGILGCSTHPQWGLYCPRSSCSSFSLLPGYHELSSFPTMTCCLSTAPKNSGAYW